MYSESDESYTVSPTCSEPPIIRIHPGSLRLQRFDFKLECEQGINNAADILTKIPLFKAPGVTEAEHFVNYVLSNSIPKTLKLHEIREATQNDQIYTKVCDAIDNDRSRFCKNDIYMKPYYVLQKEPIFHDCVILQKQNLVIRHCLYHLYTSA